jgi:cold shock CspA family protein
MSENNSSTPSFDGTRYTGRVKWFNNRAGFGFVTVLDGPQKDEDIFAHHSGIKVNDEQYKYLVQGEYVQFELRESDNSSHPYQAGNIRGIMEGMLMCETRATMRKENTNNTTTGSGDGKRRQRRPRARGSGPRGVSDNKGEGNWKMSGESQ